jgi:predicted YcjX-like family ATPase
MQTTRAPRGRYEPRWDIDLERGRVKEDLMRRLVTDDPDRLTIEVKADHVAERTHNHFAEYRQRGRNGRWRDSGVRTTKSDYWTVALPDGTAVMVPIAKMRRLVERAIEAGHTVTMTRGDNPTRGALVPLSQLVA